MRETFEDLAVLRFQGDRFEQHTLDVDCTRELIAYKNTLLACAKEIWRRKNPGRTRLPRGFEDSFSLVFSEVREGSAGIPLKRRVMRPDDDLELTIEDEFVEAARLIDQAIDAASTDNGLPADLPRNVIPLFKELGGTLASNETLYVRARDSRREVAYTQEVRNKLANWTESTYQDLAELIGEASMANLRGSQFVVTLLDGSSIGGRFSEEQEGKVLEALRLHREVKLKIKGLGEFNEADRSLRRLVRVDSTEIVKQEQDSYDENAKPIWEVVAEIGNGAPANTWSSLPSNLSERIDEIVYGSEPPKP